MAKICGKSLNSLFPYTVPVQAVIQDFRLGLLHYGLMTAIFLYVIVYQIIYRAGYLVKPELSMSVRATLRAPSLPANASNPYCCPEEHCASSLPCRRFPGPSVLHTQEEAITVVTRRKVSSLQIQSDEFVLDLEDYTLLLEPTFYCIAREPREKTRVMPGNRMPGMLQVGDERTPPSPQQHALCRESGTRVAHGTNAARALGAPCYVGPDARINGNEVFKISTLLRAMGLSLDRRNAEQYDSWNAESIRMRGIVVLLLLEMHSFEYGHGLLDEPYFVIRPMPAEHTEFNRETAMPGSDTKVDDYGLHFLLQAGGTLAHFSLTELLEQLTTSLALIAASGVVVKLLAVYVFPLGGVYYTAMTRTTPDMKTVERLMQQEEGKLEEEHHSIFRFNHKCKEEMVLSLSQIRKDSSSDSD